MAFRYCATAGSVQTLSIAMKAKARATDVLNPFFITDSSILLIEVRPKYSAGNSGSTHLDVTTGASVRRFQLVGTLNLAC